MTSGKAFWNLESLAILLKQCVEVVYHGECVGGTFTKRGWASIHTGFNASSTLSNMKQVKNRVEVLKKEWKVWEQLGKETSLGWNPRTGTPDMKDEWWDRMKEMKKGYERFWYKTLEFPTKMKRVFEGAMAEGRYQMSQQINDDDVYRPGMEDLEEGSGIVTNLWSLHQSVFQPIFKVKTTTKLLRIKIKQ